MRLNLRFLNLLHNSANIKKFPFGIGKRKILTGWFNLIPILGLVILLLSISLSKNLSSSNSNEKLGINFTEVCKNSCDTLSNCLDKEMPKEFLSQKEALISLCHVKCPKHIQKFESCLNVNHSSCKETFLCMQSKL